MDSRGSPKEGAKGTSLPRLVATPQNNQMKDLAIPLRPGNNWQDPSYKWSVTYISVWPYFGAPTWQLSCLHTRTGMPQAGREPSQVLGTRYETNKKATADPGREGINNQGVPKSKSQLKDITYNFFLPIWIWKRRDNMKFSSERADFHKKVFLPFGSFCHFSQNSPCSVVTQRVWS